jgi:hypothetical protein
MLLSWMLDETSTNEFCKDTLDACS